MPYSFALMKRFKRLMLSLTAGVSAGAVIFAASSGVAAPPKEPGSVFLDIQVSLTGKGSDPDLVETENAAQNWNYERVVSGFLELTAETTSVGEGPDQRELITYVPKLGGKAALTGRAKDTVSNQHRTFGEGGSWVDYKAKEEWNWELFEFPTQVGNEESDLRFVFDPKDATWRVTCEPETWLDLLSKAARSIYYGEATYKPGAPGGGGRGGSSSEWSHFVIKEEERSKGEKFIATRYHPGGFNSLLFVPRIEFLGVASTNTGTAYSGQADADVAPPDSARGIWKMDLALKWTIRDKLPDVELILGPKKNQQYLDWRPSAELGPQGPRRGKSLLLRAGLESPSGEDLSRIKVEKFTWKLTGTSREPGIAMNSPHLSTDRSYDLRLSGDEVVYLDDERQAFEKRNPERLFSIAEIQPYDWGGWAILQVEAKLLDGRVIQGKLDPTLAASLPLEQIRIPRSDSHSRIAMSWMREQGAVSLPDDDDTDQKPEGKPGADGDGLSLYEEYRGFYVDGKHTPTNPKKKDLFVLNQVEGADSGEIARRAVNRFKAISGLEVHKLKAGELVTGGSKNLVNFNRGEGATKGDQAGLWLRNSSAYPRPNDWIPAGSRPGKVRHVGVPESRNIVTAAPLFDGGLRGLAPAVGLEHMIVQALFQCVGVDRPGPKDRVKTFRLDLGDPATGTQPGFSTFEGPVLVIDFMGQDLAKQLAAHLKAGSERNSAPWEGESVAETKKRVNDWKSTMLGYSWLAGARGGAHSGPEECVMRDWFADIYRSTLPAVDGRPLYRVIDDVRGPEKPGTVLGSTRQGTGVNDPNRKPEPRYGDSGVSEPANKQLVVSDHK